MKTVAFHTLGCKVNQYDSEAMLSEFINAGYEHVAFDEKADIYVINTCIVTHTGERKSFQMIRRAKHNNPDAFIVVAGCLAQRDAEKLVKEGANLVIGNSDRKEVVKLIEKAISAEKSIVHVEDLRHTDFENLSVESYSEKTRAILKIQEGCDRYCTYCIIPYVRGGVRSRSIKSIKRETKKLVKNGYREIVLTGIHLSSYGREQESISLIDAISTVAEENIERIRLGSLEPSIIDEDFARKIKDIPSVCPQFHLSLQSGSDTVLKRMARRYTTQEYANSVNILRNYYPDCATTTDVICGFPAETEQEHEESLSFVDKIGFSRVHVFPYSRRSGTAAAKMSGQVSKEIKTRRAREMTAIAKKSQDRYAKGFLGKVVSVLFEEKTYSGAIGYTPEYLRVEAEGVKQNSLANVKLVEYSKGVFNGVLI
ncbi:MAG TPA: tRNA (N(6)-L-threonylcarbamoyladenosine(37)-C(2))-methylthiotransferase MtaB [Christensenellaceae bacterium]|nr:tRNA (N(6)-L-threonylcarbamoyladenosine(37)-C(2))-methylthiotransferase MtaB [Christensenellaceae bacterium]